MFPAAGQLGPNGTAYDPFVCPGGAPRKPTAAEQAQPRTQREAAAAGAVLDRINLARAREGMQPLAFNNDLKASAALVAERGLTNDPTPFSGINLLDLHVGMQWFRLGADHDVESVNAAVIVAAFMADAHIRPAVLSANDTVTGIAVRANPADGTISVGILSGKPPTAQKTAEECSYPALGQKNADGSEFNPLTCGPGLKTPTAADTARPMNDRLSDAVSGINAQINKVRVHEGVPAVPANDDLNSWASNYAYAVANGTTRPAVKPFTQVYVSFIGTGSNPAAPESVPAYMPVSQALLQATARGNILNPDLLNFGSGVAVKGNQYVTVIVTNVGPPTWPAPTANPNECGTNADGSSKYASSKCGGQVRILNSEEAKLSNKAQSAQFTSKYLPYVNQARSVQGLRPLTRTTDLDALAAGWLKNPAAPTAPAGWNTAYKHGTDVQMITAGPTTPVGVLSLNPAATIGYIARFSDSWKAMMDPAATKVGLAATHVASNNYVYVSVVTAR